MTENNKLTRGRHLRAPADDHDDTRPRVRRRPRHAFEPMFGAADQVQDMVIGRPTNGVIAFGTGEPTVAELVIDRTDPLDEPVWVVDPSGDVQERAESAKVSPRPGQP